jgi:rhodanese-related sulfurtransferase
VRSEQEFRSGHIAGALLFPVDQLADRLGEIAANKNDTVLAYCYSGNRSLAASRVLAKNGFAHVYNLKGGIMGWRREGFPLEK